MPEVNRRGPATHGETPRRSGGGLPEIGTDSIAPEFAFAWADVAFKLDAEGWIEETVGSLRCQDDTPGSRARDGNIRGLLELPDLDGMLALATTGGEWAPTRGTLLAARPHGLPVEVSAFATGRTGRVFVAVRLSRSRGADRPGKPLDVAGLSAFVPDAAAALGAGDGVVSIVAVGGMRGQGVLRDTSGAHRDAVFGRLTTFARDGGAVAALGGGVFALHHDREDDLPELMDDLTAIRGKFAGQGGVMSGTLRPRDIADAERDELEPALTCTLKRWAEVEFWSLDDCDLALRHSYREALEDLRGFRGMIDRGRFDLVFHPVLDPATGTPHHLEALTRFHEDAGGSPRRRLRFAAQMGALGDLDRAVAARVVATMARADGGPVMPVAVNLAAASLLTEGFAGELARIARDGGVAPDRLILEITDTEEIADTAALESFVREARAAGFAVCLDDLHCGGASFRYLGLLEVDYVKLDGEEIANARAARRGAAFLEALAELCRRLGVKTIAERIDEPAALEVARACKVDLVQGYLFGHPDRDGDGAAALSALGTGERR